MGYAQFLTMVGFQIFSPICFTKFLHEPFSVWAVENENKLLAVPKQPFFSQFASWKSNHNLYFVTKIVPTYCEKKIVLVIEKKVLKFEAEGQEFAKFLRSREQFIQTECFWTCSWRFLISNKLEKLKFEKIIGI